MGPESEDSSDYTEGQDMTAKFRGQPSKRRQNTRAAAAQAQAPRTRSAAKSKTGASAAPPPMASSAPGFVAAFVVPGLPHPYLIPDAHPGYRRLRDAYDAVRKEIDAIKPDLILLYSTQWLSVIGHQVQALPEPVWDHVDPEWHELGTIPYKLRMDPAFAAAYVEHGRARGLEMREVAYHGFPIDTGTVVALKLLNPRNAYPASVVSCNMYADRAETIVLGKAARDAAKATGKRVVAIGVTALSNRMHTDILPFEEDRIHSLKDDEWNRKYLEFLGKGRLEDASQLAREFATQANGDQKMKAIWWLSSVMGAANNYDGKVFAYEALYGTGAALVGLWPSAKTTADKEFDEDDAEVYLGDRNVLQTGAQGPTVLGSLSMEEQDKWEVIPPPQIVHRGGSRLVDAGPEYEALDRKAGRSRKGGGPDAAAGSNKPQISQISQIPSTRGRTVSDAAGASRSKGASGVVTTAKAPKPVGAYPHARRVGDKLYVSGIGSRVPGTDEIPGGPVVDAKGKHRNYDVAAQTHQCIANIRAILQQEGLDLEDIFDVQVFLIDMKRDFKAFNEVYAQYFEGIQAARTTVEVRALPTPIAVELKVVAQVRP